MEMNAVRKSEENILDASTSYQIEKKMFIVEPIFPQEGKETLGTVLLRLMKSDMKQL